MSFKGVVAVAGEPTSKEGYLTGKMFIPFYFGRDQYREVFHYRGMGSVIFTRFGLFSGQFGVLTVIYDPSDGAGG